MSRPRLIRGSMTELDWAFRFTGCHVGHDQSLLPSRHRIDCPTSYCSNQTRICMKITRALLSVSDKTGVVAFARQLHEFGVELLSTGGTAAALREAGLPVIEVSDYTGFPECLDGRVKTLHPKVHGGFLFIRGNAEHEAAVTRLGIGRIDLLVVNLYPFEATVAKPTVALHDAIENIDIGGPAMLRAAAKNHESVTIITDPTDYEEVITSMQENDGDTTLQLRQKLAVKVYLRTAAYDSAISTYLGKAYGVETGLNIHLPLAAELRYGDNPHQKSRLYGHFGDHFEQLHGKDLSYTNVLDIEAGAELILEFEKPTVAILKHTNPCGVGSDEHSVRAAWDKAYETDKQAPFGGVIVCNRPVPEDLARVISEIYTDIIIAPDFEPAARAIFQRKKNLRLIRWTDLFAQQLIHSPYPVIKSAPGGIMIMDRDSRALGLDHLAEKVATTRQPSKDELEAMRFGWKVVKHVKSNAIVYCGKDRTLGIGAGQMSRVDSSRLAVWKAREAGLSLEGSIVASDAFFPFPDGLIAAAEAGATAAIQPGGSKGDPDVIAAANERGMSMCFTGHRHFWH
jgi:phosphoribosylaminoimidazolecarboxamide formyltransferase / IMP cyclohydrolase